MDGEPRMVGNVVGAALANCTSLLRPNFQVHICGFLRKTMPLSRVLFAIGLTVVLLIAVDAYTRKLAANSVPRQVMRNINLAPERINVLGIGNSLMQAGFDPLAIEKRFQQDGIPVVAINGGLGATGVIEHLVLGRMAFSQHKVATLIYGFADQQLIVDIPHMNSDLIGNRSMLYEKEPQLTLQYADFDARERLLFRIYGSSSLLSERGFIWAKVEKLRRVMDQFGMPGQATNRFGRSADFSLLEAGDPRTFERQCRIAIDSHRLLSAPVQALLTEAKNRGTTVIVVEMPMSPVHVRLFYSQPIWEEYRSKTREAVETYGAVYLDASQWITQEANFADHLHLSSQGAARFSQMLAEYLIENHRSP